MENNEITESSTNLDPKLAAMLCYLGIFITGIIFFMIEKKSRYVRYHAMQSIIVFGILSIISFVLGFIPVIGMIINLVYLVIWIVLMVSAYQGKWVKAPFASDIAERQSAKF
ncbi:DUF4870 domain-containing protein [Aureibacillus halotolerans]|uniref:Putative membrane protein n=1 Tax=Aureibacillus halotolerans TaxID=1508390 RepID=A0A4R6U324_9BACI|nr:DUF4870 domain-containing protein [Aureibacillus halotolerans]TDQ40848.1 putative membrane protein [Aureibacillus halotolerans]